MKYSFFLLLFFSSYIQTNSLCRDYEKALRPSTLNSIKCDCNCYLFYKSLRGKCSSCGHIRFLNIIV